MKTQSLFSHLIDRLRDHYSPTVIKTTSCDNDYAYKQLMERTRKRIQHKITELGEAWIGHVNYVSKAKY